MQHLSALLLAPLAVAACAAPSAPTAHREASPTLEAPAPAAQVTERFASEEPSGGEAVHGIVAQVEDASAPRGPASSRAQNLPSDDLAIWRSASFKRAFAESYLAETEIEPTVTTTERDTLIEVRDAIAADDIEEAKRLLTENGGEAASATFDFMLGNLYFQNEELEDALDHYAIATEKSPKFRRAWKNMGIVGVRLGDFEAAAKSFSRVVELGGGDGLTYGLLGYAYMNLENNLSAESAYRMAILLDPVTDDWKMGLARSLFKQSRYSEAVSLTSSMLKVEPSRADLWLLQANAYLGSGDPMAAAENFELVDRLGESTIDSLNLLGDIYINAELFDLAESAYARAMAVDAEGFQGRALRAASNLAARGALDETAALLDVIDATYGGSFSVEDQKGLLRLRSRIALAHGGGDEEARVLEEIVALDPLDGQALILLGQHARLAGDLEEAVFYFERAEALEDFEADAKVRHAQLLVGEGRYSDALPLLKRAQAIKPRENIQEYLDQVERLAKGR